MKTVSERDVTFGVIGLSPGNGHPYSWSAIINGYDRDEMSRCPFPVIPEYLDRQNWPDSRIARAAVTHVHAPEPGAAADIAMAARIPYVSTLDELIDAVDAVLLARDDAENHARFARPILAAGKPVYIDKPIALNRGMLDELIGMQSYDRQIFTASALSFSPELLPLRDVAGEVSQVEAVAPKDWPRYAMHAIEPVISALWDRICGQPYRLRRQAEGGVVVVHADYGSGLTCTFKTTGTAGTPFRAIARTPDGTRDYVHQDTFAAFRSALQSFVDGVRAGRSSTDLEMVEHCVEIIEAGA